jgi:PAS domain S-box-containing protein
METTLRSIGDGVISTDNQGQITLMNDLAAKLTGWTSSRALGMKASEVFRIRNTQTGETMENPSDKVLATGKSVREDLGGVLITHHGTEQPVSFEATPILDQDGWIIGSVIAFRDITRLQEMEKQREELIRVLSDTNIKRQSEIQKHEEARRAALNLMQDAQLAQASLRESEERLRILFEGIDDPLFVHDGTGRILDCNRAACESLGYNHDELIGRNMQDIQFQPPDQSSAQRLLTRIGGSFPVHIHSSNVRFGGMDATLSVARDITELTRTQDELRDINQQLRESNTLLEEYAHVASHDLQEPLRKIESFAQVMVEDYGTKIDAKGHTYLDIMVNASKRMRRLIRDILAFARVGTEERPFTTVDLNDVLAVVRDNLSERLREKKATVIVKPLPTLEADETLMVQLFQNLVSNGLKFNESPTPRVEVACTEGRTDWHITVKDNGIGMRGSESHNIFAPFKRLHTQQKFEGTGIGLTVCRRIVTLHGGNIGVQSEFGQGSTFWMNLPKMKHRRAEELPEPAPHAVKEDGS